MRDQTLKTIILTAVDATDLNNKQWEWQTTTSVTIAKVWPDEPLQLQARAPHGSKILPQDQFARRIDYYQR
jgi:hypothetical protein